MPITTLGFIPTSWATGEQPGTTLKVENSGMVVIDSTFEFTPSVFESEILPILGRVEHPRYSFAKQEGPAICTEEPGVVVVRLTFMGTQSNLQFNADDPETQEQEPPVFSMGRASESSPIFTNPFFNSLTPDDKKEVRDAWISGEGKPAAYDEWDTVKQKLYDKLVSGTDSWRAPRLTWTVEYATNNPISTGIARKQGRICKPWGPAPSLPENRDWILDQMEDIRQGGSQRIRLVWLASGPGGNDPDLYTAPEEGA